MLWTDGLLTLLAESLSSSSVELRLFVEYLIEHDTTSPSVVVIFKDWTPSSPGLMVKEYRDCGEAKLLKATKSNSRGTRVVRRRDLDIVLTSRVRRNCHEKQTFESDSVNLFEQSCCFHMNVVY